MLLLLFAGCAAWQYAEVSPPLPTPRAGHTLTSYQGEMYLFGGCNLDLACYNDLYKYNSTTEYWEKLAPGGERPVGREGHSATLVGNKIYVYGGSTLTELLDDVFVLDLQKGEWSPAGVAGNTDPRAYHSAALFDSGLILIFGGLTSKGLTDQILIIDTIQRHWGKPPTVGVTKPSPRKLSSFNRHGDYL